MTLSERLMSRLRSPGSPLYRHFATLNWLEGVLADALDAEARAPQEPWTREQVKERARHYNHIGAGGDVETADMLEAYAATLHRKTTVTAAVDTARMIVDEVQRTQSDDQQREFVLRWLRAHGWHAQADALELAATFPKETE
jgi:hypothetical protein